MCSCLRAMASLRMCAFPLHIRGSGSCVKTVYRWPAGQRLYREVEARQARFKYLRGSDGAEPSNPSFSEDPSEASLSQSSFHRFTHLSSFASLPRPLSSSIHFLSLDLALCSYLSFFISPLIIPANLSVRQALDFFLKLTLSSLLVAHSMNNDSPQSYNSLIFKS